MRLVQLQNARTRRVAMVDEAKLRLLRDVSSIYELVSRALEGNTSLTAIARGLATDESLDYDPIHTLRSDWHLLPPIDHPQEPARCLVSGTGLTHLGSAKDRQAMHAVTENETDSMRMFRWGVEGGRPAPGKIGAAPEWFYKGTGTILHAHGEPLLVPSHAEDGGEEAEIAGLYVIDPQGHPRRVGMAVGNEFSDHRFEKRNYLNLAGSKLRTCAIGPELVIDPTFDSVAGQVTIERAGTPLWTKQIRTGEAEMCHNLANIEHHHFKFDAHRRPGDVHVHFFGAHSLSFGDGVELQDGDMMVVRFENFGRALQNPVRIDRSTTQLVPTIPMK
jgi:hypothetical protein